MILTSNRTREVHDALKRRCLYHWIDYPSAQKEFEIVQARPRGAGTARPRGVGLRPPPPRGGPHESAGLPRRSTGRLLSLSLERARARAGAGRRDARRRPRIRGGHPSDPRRDVAPLPARGGVARPGRADEHARVRSDQGLPLDLAVVRSPFGGWTSWRRFWRRRSGLARALRAAGIRSTWGGRRLRRVTLTAGRHRPQVGVGRWAPTIAPSQDDREVYDRVFDWMVAPAPAPAAERRALATAPTTSRDPPRARRLRDRPRRAPGAEERWTVGERAAADVGRRDESVDEADIDGHIAAPDAYSASGAAQRDFDRMTPAELRDAERLVDLLEPRLELRTDPPLRAPPPRPAARPAGDVPAEPRDRRPVHGLGLAAPIRRPRKIVVLCDISGSMERHSRLLLRFVQALSAASSVKTESFVFGTRLTRVTRLLTRTVTATGRSPRR